MGGDCLSSRSFVKPQLTSGFYVPKLLLLFPSLTRITLSAGMPAAGQLPPGFLMWVPRLEALDLSQTGSFHFPMDALSLAALRSLNLSTNKIQALPDQIGMMTRWVQYWGGGWGESMGAAWTCVWGCAA